MWRTMIMVEFLCYYYILQGTAFSNSSSQTKCYFTSNIKPQHNNISHVLTLASLFITSDIFHRFSVLHKWRGTGGLNLPAAILFTPNSRHFLQWFSPLYPISIAKFYSFSRVPTTLGIPLPALLSFFSFKEKVEIVA